MQLTGARIMNYRSIKDVTLKFSHNCRILVGKNETGKSNILKALSLLSDTNNFSAEDKRTLLPNEEFKSDPFVQFHFVLENSEITEVYDNLKTKVLCKNFKSPIIRDNNGTEFTLESFCKLRNSGLYEVNFNNNTRIARYWKIESKYKTINSWMKPRTDAGQPLLVQFGEQAIDLSDYQIINIEEYPEIFTQKMDLLESVTPDYISSLIGKLICSYIDSKRMQTIFWSYDEKNLLPSRINTIEFASNPEICIPLKSMFELAGVDNIYTYAPT